MFLGMKVSGPGARSRSRYWAFGCITPRRARSVRHRLLSGYAGGPRAFGLGIIFFRKSDFLVRILRRARHGVFEAMDDMSGSPKGSTAAVSETEHLAPAEVLENLDSLSAHDKRRLRLIERRRRAGTHFPETELYAAA